MESVEGQLEKRGYRVRNSTCLLTHGGDRFFGDEVALSRKHTSRLFEDLDQRIEASFTAIFDEWSRNDLRVMSYREHELEDREAHDLVVKSVDAEALALSAIPRVLKEWREPWHEEFTPRNAWSLFNGFTEVMKGKPHLLADRTRTLQRVFDEALGIA